MNTQTSINIDELERLEKGFTRLIQRTCSILLFDESHLKCQSSLRTLKTDGFQNVITTEKLSNIEVLLKAHKFRLVVLDGETKDNESFKFFLALKQKGFENLPAFIFTRDEVTEKGRELYKKAGAIGCIKRPVVAEEIELIMEKVFHFNKSGDNEYQLEVKEFGESILFRVRGALTEENLPEFHEKISTNVLTGSSLILDFSKVSKVHEHLKRIITQKADELSKVQTKLEIYDPRHKLSFFDIENSPNIHFI